MDRLAKLEAKANRTPEEEALRVALVGLRDAPKEDKVALEKAEAAVGDAEAVVGEA